MPREPFPRADTYPAIIELLEGLGEDLRDAWASRDDRPKYEAASELWWTWKKWRGKMPLPEAVAAYAWREGINLRRDPGMKDEARNELRALLAVTLKAKSARTTSTVAAALARLKRCKTRDAVVEALRRDGFEGLVYPTEPRGVRSKSRAAVAGR